MYYIVKSAITGIIYFYREDIMGICFGWLSRGNLLSHQNPPPLDREETYKDCKIYFHESHEKADQLQQNFVSMFFICFKCFTSD